MTLTVTWRQHSILHLVGVVEEAVVPAGAVHGGVPVQAVAVPAHRRLTQEPTPKTDSLRSFQNFTVHSYTFYIYLM